MSSLEYFVLQVRAIMDRGLAVHPDDILDGLQFALGEQRVGQAVDFGLGVEHIEGRLRRRAEAQHKARRTAREQAEADQQTSLPFPQK